MTTYHSRMMNIARQGAGRVDVFDFDSFESGHHHGHKAARHAAAEIANEADAEIARLQAQVAELQALSVTHILLDVVPGDGYGQEVYAKSVADVEALLLKLDERADEADSLQAQVDALAGALRPVLEHARHVNDTGGPSGEGWQSERLIAQIAAADAALATVGR